MARYGKIPANNNSSHPTTTLVGDVTTHTEEVGEAILIEEVEEVNPNVSIIDFISMTIRKD